MAVLATLRQDRAGDWTSLDDFLRELRHRETSAVGALGNALAAPAHEQKELAEHGEAGAILLEVACDLRVPKGSRLAAARCLLEAGIEPPFIGHLFTGAGDLVTDPRLGAAGRKLVESGLPCALGLGGEAAQITLAAGAFARAVQAGASALGTSRVKELLSAAPELHAGALAGLFAIGAGELPEGHKAGWKRLLEQTCTAHRRAPAAARRMGLVPAWPPNLPEAFAPFIREAEQQSASVQSADAARDPATLRKAEAEPVAVVRGKATPPKLPDVAPGKKMAPAIRRSPFRKPLGTVVEVPVVVPAKPMEPVVAQPPDAERPPPRIEPKRATATLSRTLPVPPLPSLSKEGPRFDARGNRVPRADRWQDEGFDWAPPILPSSEMPPPARAAPAAGPFVARLQSLFEDRPEAVDRLCAAAEAFAALRGEDRLGPALSAELALSRWRDRRLPPEQRHRLGAIAQGAAHPPSWRAAANLLLDFFVSGGA
ncbi:hypothetical protein [Rhizobium sp.]|uniref:hypothetical protein n=1 Tax=Rhizobium sp. TaxID=391 RepID=UPI00389A016E